MKKLEDLVTDIYELFNPDNHHEVKDENLEIFAKDVTELLRRRLEKQAIPADRPVRFSSLGKPDRQVWMDAHPDPANEEKLLPKTYIKFLFGDILEQLLLFLAREAGHTVEDIQRGVEIEGITGSIDARIDGVVTDAKSASPFGFKKFQSNDVNEDDDPFGYIKQLSGYADVIDPGKPAAWLAINKVDGAICVADLPAETIANHKPLPRINHLKEVVEREEPPELCYQPIPDGKSGNLKLPTGCSYCRHKFRCHPNLRVFFYAQGPRFLTEVARVPDVPELNRENYQDES